MLSTRALTRFALLPVALASLSGCATLIHGTHQGVKVTSTPNHSSVALNGHTLGKTPLTAQVPRKGGQTLVVTHPGYYPYAVRFKHHLSAVGYGADVLSWGIYSPLFAGGDAADGAGGWQSPKTVQAKLVPLSTSANNLPISVTDVPKGQGHAVVSAVPGSWQSAHSAPSAPASQSSASSSQSATSSANNTATAANGPTHHHHAG